MDTAIQNAIVNKKIVPAAVSTDKLSALIDCATMAKAHVGSPWQKIRSSVNTKPLALSAGGPESSNKLLVADSKSET
jgi:hypothetical protein